MNRKTAAVLLCLPLLLGGCDAFFTNVFEGLAPLKVPSASELGSLPMPELERLAEDPDFFAALAADPEKLDAVKTSLFAKFDVIADTPEEQRAAALYAEVLLKTSGVFGVLADDAFSALSGVLDQFETAAGSEYPGLAASLALDLFDGRTPTLAVIQGMLDALSEAWSAYRAIGDGLAVGAALDSSLNAGDMLVFAALGALLDGVAVTGGESCGPDL